MYSIGQTPTWFRYAQARLGKPTSDLRKDIAAATRDPLRAVERIWRSQRRQTAWLQLW